MKQFSYQKYYLLCTFNYVCLSFMSLCHSIKTYACLSINLYDRFVALAATGPKRIQNRQTSRRVALKELCHGILIHFADLKKIFSH